MIITFIQRAIMQSIPLLFGSTGETITEKGGNLNLGIPGIMYVGGICGVIGAFFYEKSVETVNPFLAVLIPLLSSILGSALMGLLYCFLTVTLRANQNVTGLAMTTFGVGFGNFFGGSLIKITGSDIPSIALSATSNCFKTTLPLAAKLGKVGDIFFSYSFLAYAAIIIALITAYFFKHTICNLYVKIMVFVGGVHYMKKQICIGHLFQSGLKSFHQRMRQFAYKSYGIYQNKLPAALRSNITLLNIKSSKKHITFKNRLVFLFRYCQKPVHKRRFSRIGIPHKSRHRNLVFFPLCALSISCVFKLRKFFFYVIHSTLDVSSVSFQFLFSGTPCSYTASQS